LVRNDQSKFGDHHSYWKAKVLETRALDSQHVYLRVVWINRPEDLPAGREQHHAIDELIPSNQMDFVDAIYVKGPVEVIHWSKRPGVGNAFNSTRPQYFWRQTYNYCTKQFVPASNTADIENGAT
jgi:hypothetical protein